MALVDDNPTGGTGVVLLQVLHQTAPADCDKANLTVTALTETKQILQVELLERQHTLQLQLLKRLLLSAHSVHFTEKLFSTV